MDMFALVLGFSIGIVVLALALELGMKKSSRDVPRSNYAFEWDLSEIENPRIVAEFFIDSTIPENAKVVVGQWHDKEILRGHDVKKYEGVKGNFVLGEDRALILSGPFKNDEIGIWTVEKEIVERLNRDFVKMWSNAKRLRFKEKEKKK